MDSVNDIYNQPNYDSFQDNKVLEGLGAIIRQPFSDQQKSVIKKFADTKVKTAMANTVQNRGQRAIIAQINKLDEQVQVDINSGKARFVTRDYYIRKRITVGASGMQEMIDPSDDVEIGIRNLSGEGLPKGENLMLTKIKLSYAYAATENAVDNVRYSNAMDQETADVTPVEIPLAILNGEAEIKVAGAIVATLPIKKFFRDGLSVSIGVEGKDDAVELENPILIMNKQNISILIKTAKTGSITVDSTHCHYLEARLMGVAIAPRS